MALNICSSEDLTESVNSALSRYQEAEHIYVAYSGGLDSRVLLHLCASLSFIRDKITSVYVHHGLQAEADAWGEHCAETAGKQGFRFMQIQVDGRPEPGSSGEEAARIARYRALKSLLNSGDVLVTGQHREDQLETILLQLFRGAGLAGLSGMPEEAVFGKGKIVRPLIDISKSDIEKYAHHHHLTWVEDPSNKECDFDRNFLRHRVIPLLKERWPSIDKTVVRAGKHCAEAQNWLSRGAVELLRSVLDESTKTLNLDLLQKLDRYERQLVVRDWFRMFGLRMPSTSFVDQILDQVAAASFLRDPKLHKQGLVVRRYRDRLYLLSFVHPVKVENAIEWPTDKKCIHLEHNGKLHIIQTSRSGLSKESWNRFRISVRYRKGGESIRIRGRKGRHTLKKLFQEAGVPPWLRERIPLIYFDEKLAAVGGKWIDDEFYRCGNGENLSLQWTPPDFTPKSNHVIFGTD